MFEVTAITDKDSQSTNVETAVNANGIEYITEVISIIESLMRGLKNNDIHLHALVLKVLVDYPHILLGDEGDDGDDSDKARAFEATVATAKFKGGIN